MDWTYILLSWVSSIAIVFATIAIFGMHLSLSAVLVALPIPVMILYENRRQSILMFILEQKHRKLLLENNRMAEEIQANELRHMVRAHTIGATTITSTDQYAVLDSLIN